MCRRGFVMAPLQIPGICSIPTAMDDVETAEQGKKTGQGSEEGEETCRSTVKAVGRGRDGRKSRRNLAQ